MVLLMFPGGIGLQKYGWDMIPPKLPGQQPSSKVDFCARSVIGGDPNLDTEQVGVPRCIWVYHGGDGNWENCLYVF